MTEPPCRHRDRTWPCSSLTTSHFSPAVRPPLVARADDDRATLPAQRQNLAVLEPDDLTLLPGLLVHLEQLPLHAGADQKRPAQPGQRQHQHLAAEPLADCAVGADTVDAVLAGNRGR